MPVAGYTEGELVLTRWRSLVVAAIAVAVTAVPAISMAAVPSSNFTLGNNGLPVPAPAPYQATTALYGESLTYNGAPIGAFNGIQDIFTDSAGDLWIVDTGNNRVVELNPTYTKVLMVLGGATATAPAALKSPEGIFVDAKGFIYVADTGNDRIAVYAPNGTYLDQIQPVGQSLSLSTEKVKFVPTKVAIASNGTMFVAISGEEFGLAEFDSSGKFLGFFAPNYVGFQWRYYLEKLLETQAQLAQQFPILLPAVDNVTIGQDGYIYTTSIAATSKQIRRLNVVGTDTLNTPTNSPHFGLPISDLPPYVIYNLISSGGNGSSLNPHFVSATADQNGIITALDQTTDFVFQYGPNGNLLYTFGGLNGDGMLGYFQLPSSVATNPAGDIVVSDQLANNVQVFTPTKFARLVQAGIALDYQGHYGQAEADWNQVLHYDANYDLAHDEIGQGYLAAGQNAMLAPTLQSQLTYFKEALQEFYTAADKGGFGDAFGWYRHVWMRINFGWVFLTFIGFWIAVYALYKIFAPRLRRHPVQFTGNWARSEFARVVPMSWRMIKHPGEAFFQLKFERLGTWRQGVILVAIALVVRVANLLLTNFDMSPLVPGQSNLLYQAVKFILPLATWIVANYLVGDLYEGEADLGEIIAGASYALVPFIVMQLPLAVLTHVFVPTDHFYNWFVLFERIWVIYMFFTQVRVLHNLEWLDAVKASLMTLLGVVILWAMMAILYGLGEQAFTFVHQVIQEIILLHS